MSTMRLDTTRSSQHWNEKPGNWDKLNLRHIFPSSNKWGIPDLPQSGDQIPKELIAWNDRYRMTHPKPGDCAHFFLDDYRFETVWTWPDRAKGKAARVGQVLTPDFSLWVGMPLSAQMWQVYRSRWCGAWLASHGVKVIPTVSWSTPDSYDLAFLGIPQGNIVAVSTVGITDPESVILFHTGLTELINVLHPSSLLVYGGKRHLFDKVDSVDVVFYATRWDSRRG